LWVSVRPSDDGTSPGRDSSRTDLSTSHSLSFERKPNASQRDLDTNPERTRFIQSDSKEISNNILSQSAQSVVQLGPLAAAPTSRDLLRCAKALVETVAAEVAAGGGAEQAAAIMAGTLGSDGRLQVGFSRQQ
jgi:hypothetical protein